MKKYQVLFVILIFGLSCRSSIKLDEAKTKVYSAFSIVLSDSVKILNSQAYPTLSPDYSEEFSLQLSKDEFNAVFKAINPKVVGDKNSELYGCSIFKENEIFSLFFYPNKYAIRYTYRAE